MSKFVRILVAAGMAVALLGSATAEAAAPGAGTLSKTKRTLSWAGGPFNISYPTSEFECLDGRSDSMCDHFLLKVNMGQGARIKVAIVGSTTGLEPLQVVTAPNDYDLYVYNSGGAKVGDSFSGSGREAVTFTHRASERNKPYEVRVVPFLVIPGATYKGTATTLKYVK